MTHQNLVLLLVLLKNIRNDMGIRNNDRVVIQRVIDKNTGNKKKKKVVQLSIKIDENIDDVYTLSKSLNISKNKLIEDIFLESGIVQEVDENYTKVR